MVGYFIKFKDGFAYGSPATDDAYRMFELDKPQEAGDIINGHWFIINTQILYDSDRKQSGKFNKGQSVRVVDLKYLDLVATDKVYENDDRLKKYHSKTGTHNGEDVLINKYIVLI